MRNGQIYLTVQHVPPCGIGGSQALVQGTLWCANSRDHSTASNDRGRLSPFPREGTKSGLGDTETQAIPEEFTKQEPEEIVTA